MLDDDCVRVIVKHAALLAEEDFKPQQLSLEDATLSRFSLRAPALSTLALVSRQFRDAAELELENFIVLTPRNYDGVAKAIKERRVGGRVRHLVAEKDGQEGEEVDPRTLDPILEACERLEELSISGWRVSFSSMIRMKNLVHLSLFNTTVYGGAPEVVIPSRLTHLVLHNTLLDPADLETLAKSCEGSLQYFQPRRLRPEQVARIDSILTAARPTLRTLDMQMLSTTNHTGAPGSHIPCNVFLPHLEHFTRLEQLKLFVGQFTLARDFLTRSTSPPSLRSLHIRRPPERAPIGGDAEMWDEPLLALLDALQSPAFSKLEFILLDMMRAWFDPANGGLDSTPLYEVKEAAKVRGIEVKVT